MLIHTDPDTMAVEGLILPCGLIGKMDTSHKPAAHKEEKLIAKEIHKMQRYENKTFFTSIKLNMRKLIFRSQEEDASLYVQ